MHKTEYQRLLFHTAMCVMACDGEIHDDEVREIKLAFEATQFFNNLDYETEIKLVLDSFHRSEKDFFVNCIEELKSAELNPVQALQVLEVSLRIIYADNRIDENEMAFLRLIKENLGVPSEIFKSRFGNVPLNESSIFEDAVKRDFTATLDNLSLPDNVSLAAIFNDTKLSAEN